MELALIVTTAVSVVLATAMGIVAWRLARGESRRSAARVTALAADLRRLETPGEEPVIGLWEEAPALDRLDWPMEFDNLELRPGGETTPAHGEMFRGGTTERSGSRMAAVLAVGSFAVVTALALVIATSREGSSISDLVALQTLPPAQPAIGLPLELVTLNHEREDDRITIRGEVRNPRGGASLDRLTAVVSLFDRDGAFLGNGGAAIEAAALAPGAESTFVVIMGRATTVGRYRVSFTRGDQVVPHVDRRNAALESARADR